MLTETCFDNIHVDTSPVLTFRPPSLQDMIL